MSFDAVVLAGGRSSRLDGEPKAQLLFEGRTLLEGTIEAVSDARHVVVVGLGPVPAGVHLTRETPEFAGPCAALAAGVARLDQLERHEQLDCLDQFGDGVPADDATLVVSCDMPMVAAAIGGLLAAWHATAGGWSGEVGGDDGAAGGESVGSAGDGVMTIDGVVAVDRGRPQYLAAVYRRSSLRAAVAGLDGGVVNASMRRLVAGMRLAEVMVPDSSTADIDTWADARHFGVIRPQTASQNVTEESRP